MGHFLEKKPVVKGGPVVGSIAWINKNPVILKSIFKTIKTVERKSILFNISRILGLNYCNSKIKERLKYLN